MKVHLSFDTEIWCNGWDRLDAAFPGSFQRYVYGRSSQGDYALPKTIEILNRHGLRGVFFVEPLFAARFGKEHLATIVGMLRDGGQDVQLHLHPEWTDEITPAPIPNASTKRQHLIYYTQDEQAALIGFGRELLEAAGSGPVTAFRSGSFAANADTFAALQRNGILIDSSLNRCHDVSGPDMPQQRLSDAPFMVGNVLSYPVSVFRDGFGRARPAQVGACSFPEFRDALKSAQQGGGSDFTIVSHNFEMLKPGASDADMTVARRFERLCAFLGENRATFPVGSYEARPHSSPGISNPGISVEPSTAKPLSTAIRYAEQLARRFAA